MKYISKGMVIRASTEDLLFVTRCGADFQLTGEQAALWLNGRFGFAKNRENVLEVTHQMIQAYLGFASVPFCTPIFSKIDSLLFYIQTP